MYGLAHIPCFFRAVHLYNILSVLAAMESFLAGLPPGEAEEVFFWFDIFCVNQHLRSPYGGLLAFAFDPLRNAIVGCDRLLLFFETWDDPAPLGRVWCLDELRTALLLGKPVEEHHRFP